MESKDLELRSILTGQHFEPDHNHEPLLHEAKALACSFAKLTNGIAVLSDFCNNKCYSYSGKFGQNMFSLPEYSVDGNSPFEEEIFNGIRKDDLLERHILELRFFNLIKSIPDENKTNYLMSCIIRFNRPDGTIIPVLHTSRYIQCHTNGSVWLALCTYIPLPLSDACFERGIINSVTGETVKKDQYATTDSTILSKRQTEILSLLARGNGSKQIAEKLHISVHTVNRHRQDILAALKVTNSSSAVEIAMRLHLI